MTKTETQTALASAFRGDIITPSDETYDDVRALYNAMIDKRPGVIARCRDAGDVIAALRFARAEGLPIAIRGGGHSGPGLGSCDDGIMIDLSLMKGVRVDAKARTVRAEPGCTQGDVDHATAAFGLAVPAGIVGTTGIAGLTLGGGHGYLSRAHGLTIDNLIEADLVLADGSFVTASATEHSDLFWAIRGGGGNFGIATSFLFRAHPVSTIYGGPIFWDIRHAREIMQVYREFLPAAPERLSAFLALKTVPSTAPFPEEIWGRRICAVVSCFNGPEADGQKALAPLLDKIPDPIFAHVGMMPFASLQSLFDPLMPKGLQWYWKGDFVVELTDAAIAAHIEHGSKSPSELSLMHLYPIDGAVRRVGERETAWSCRDATWSMVIAGISPDPAQAGALKRWGRDYWRAVHPHNRPGGYVNFMMDDEGEARIEATYGANYRRLAEIKKKYDPENVFRVNQNIPPAA